MVWRPHALHAEDQDFRFQPPKPPPLDFDDEDDEEFGDEMGRPAGAGPAVINPPGGAAKVEPVAPPVAPAPGGWRRR